MGAVVVVDLKSRFVWNAPASVARKGLDTCKSSFRQHRVV